MRALPRSALVLTYLQVHLGRTVTNEDLRRVSELDDVPRALRQLRADGWPIDVDGRGGARLRREERGDPRGDSRAVPARMRVAVLERDAGRCRLCGIAAGEINLDGRPTRIEADHIVPRHDGGATNMENLRALCHVCNHDKQAANPLLSCRVSGLSGLTAARPAP